MRAIKFFAVLLLLGVFASAGTYTVRRGDTLGAIAERHGVSVAALTSANGIPDPDRVREGQVLTIPGAGAPGAPPAGAVHRVSAGETLGGIAARRGTSVARLMELNGISNPNRIREGQVLRVDGGPTWVCPVAAPVRFVSVFGDPRGGGRRHEGVDLAAPSGTVVVANTSGFFKRNSNALGGHAYFLEGDDGNVYYGAHLSEYIGFNRWVPLGEPIGRVGTTGNAAGGIPHLHFEQLPRGGPAVNPFGLLDRACFKR